MKKLFSLFLLLIIISSCSSVKNLKEGELLLTKNTIYIDGQKDNSGNLNKYILLQPNKRTLGLPLPIYLYNLGFKKNGTSPILLNKVKIDHTVKNLKKYYQTQGYFKSNVSYKIKTDAKHHKASVTYFIEKNEPIMIDTVLTAIKSPLLKKIYQKKLSKSFLKSKRQYNDADFRKEANRIIKLYRNQGIYHFSDAYINFDIDTLQSYNKASATISVPENSVTEKDGTYLQKPFKKYRYKNINVITDYNYQKKNAVLKDSITYNGINFYAYDKIKYNPKILAQSIFIKKDTIYKDSLAKLTVKHLQSLKNFKSINFTNKETTDSTLTTNILLTPSGKYTSLIKTELSRSNIRTIDISGQFSLINKNTFKGAELLKLSFSGSYFTSRNGPGWELGSDISLEIPRLVAPFGISKFVPKYMYPKTTFFTGISIQKNIGLDRQNIRFGVDYSWNINSRNKIRLELLNTQYIRNLNTSNYFDIYNSELNKLIKVANVRKPDYQIQKSNINEIVNFMNETLHDPVFAEKQPNLYQNNANILNRYNIITSDFLIPEIVCNYEYNSKEHISDKNFAYFNVRLANSGNILGLLLKNKNLADKKTLLKIPLAQYFKTDFEYRKFWDTSNYSTFGIRTLIGAVIPYGNSDIPFSKSYFAGGSNDIRAWRAYELGPSNTPRGLEYNIGNFKILGSLEYRFDIVNNLKGALFADFGNIWDFPKFKINKIDTFKHIAIGTGLGVRYDFKFLIGRLDWAFKVREPYALDNSWFQNFNIDNSVLNIGINYPF